jgi:hypothetical protein
VSARLRLAPLALLAASALVTSSPVAGQWAAPPGKTVRNAFGPTIGTGAALCRGACGADCPPTCKVTSYWDCTDPQLAVRVTSYDCGTHRGCREHDDCLDECSRRYPGSGRVPTTFEGGVEEGVAEVREFVNDEWRPIDRNFYTGECSRDCHAEGLFGFGFDATNSWRKGGGPYDGRSVFEYTRAGPDAPRETFGCADDEVLVCTPLAVSCRPRELDLAVSSDRDCVPAGESAKLTAEVSGLSDPRVRWTVEGSAAVDADGRLRPTGEGRVRVTAESVQRPGLLDTLELVVGRCGCTFTATVGGDSSRGSVSGVSANFSTRGQATILGGSVTPEALEDLMRITRMTRSGDGELERQMAQVLERQIAERREQGGATAGSTVGISLVETRAGGIGPASGGGLATAFKLDVLSKSAIEPGFAGALPVDNLVLHTGEFAAEGGAPMLYRWSADEPGNVLLHVSRYDGRWLEGSVVAELEGVTGLMKTGGGKPRIQARADFRAGAFNPLRFENVCAFAQAGE